MDNGNAFSYSTMIRQLVEPGLSIGNKTKYSKTTSRHQRQTLVGECKIVMDDVPVGCQDLYAIAVERGHVKRYREAVEMNRSIPVQVVEWTEGSSRRKEPYRSPMRP
jgi:hypothetical protein